MQTTKRKIHKIESLGEKLFEHHIRVSYDIDYAERTFSK